MQTHTQRVATYSRASSGGRHLAVYGSKSVYVPTSVIIVDVVVDVVVVVVVVAAAAAVPSSASGFFFFFSFLFF